MRELLSGFGRVVRDEVSLAGLRSGQRLDCIVVNWADNDVIVSSSFLYAVTLQVPVVAVETPFLRWIATRVGPDLLRLHADVEALCAAIGSEPHRAYRNDPLAAATVERECGDATVREALRRALDFPPA